MPSARRLVAAAAEGEKVYVFGGCGSPCFDPVLHPSTLEETLVEVYDPQTDRWRTSPRPMPAILFGAAAAAPGNGRIYTFGGYVSSNVVQEYDPLADAWRLRAPMPTPRFGLAAVALEGKVYALGGSGPSGALEIYDPAANTWSLGAPMPTARVFLAAAALGGKIYAIGGSPDCCGGSQTDVMEVYDPATGSWSTVARLPVAAQVSAAAAIGGKLYAVGLFVPGVGALPQTYEYDPTTGEWTARAPMQAPRDQAAGAVIDGALVLAGGATDCHCQALRTVDSFRPAVEGPPPLVDLAVSLTTSPAPPYCPLEEVSYRLVVENRGAEAAAGAVLEAGASSHLTGVSAVCEGVALPCSGLSGCNLSLPFDLAAGDSLSCTFTGRVAVGAPAPVGLGQVVVDARVEPPPGLLDQVPADNHARLVSAVPPPRSDLAITMTDNVTAVTSGETLTYLITVSNLGPCPVTGARVKAPFGPELTQVAWSCIPTGTGTCQPDGSGPIHDVVTLPVSGEVTYTATAVVTAAGGCPQPPCTPVENIARVLAPGGVCGPVPMAGSCDPAPANNRASDVDTMLPPPHPETDLVITKTVLGDSPRVLAGDEVAYVITVTNLGPSAVSGAEVRDDGPPGLDLPAWTCEGAHGGRCTPAGIGGIDDPVDLPVNGTVTYELRGVVDAAFLCPLENSAEVSAPEGVIELVPGNNVSSAEVMVFRPGPGFAGCKRVVAFSPADGMVTFEIRLLNPGPFDQLDNQGSELVDALPEGLAFGPGPASASSGTLVVEGHTVAWNGSIPAGGEVTITLPCHLTGEGPAGVICNRGKLFVDTDGDGFHDAVRVTDDPALPETFDLTCLPPDAVPVSTPTLSPLGALVLGLALMGLGLARLRRRG